MKQKIPAIKLAGIGYKLVSRILFLNYHLSAMGITATPVSAYPGSSGEQPSGDPIHGISARKVYPHIGITDNSRRLLPYIFTLTPSLSIRLRRIERGRQLFSVALSVGFYTTRLLTGTLLLAVRTFLPCFKTKSIAQLAVMQK